VSGQLVDLLLTRSATGVFSAYVNGNLAFSFLDSTAALGMIAWWRRQKIGTT